MIKTNKNEYLEEINTFDFNDLEKELINYAKENNIPIIKKEGLAFLLQIVKIKNPKKILEIGTAIGFSAIMMAENSKAKIITLEKNSELIEKANQNILKFNLDKRIKVVHTDALEYDAKNNKFDLIFIDAAKTKYIEYFEKFKPFLTKKGLIVCDNLLFHDLLFTEEEEITKNQKRIITKIDLFNHFLMNQKDFISHIYEIGDGMSLSIRKE